MFSLFNTYPFKEIYIVHGLKRSGNHAIMRWITAQGKFHVLNNAIPIVPFLQGLQILEAPKPYNTWLKNRFSRRRFSLVKRIFQEPYSLLISIEDHELSTLLFTDPLIKVTHILILRDPVNMFASRIRKSALVKSPAYPDQYNVLMERVIGLWKRYAAEFLGDTHILENKICIYFNAWHSSRDYRMEIAKRLGLTFTDAGYQDVPDIGGGSSFDGITFNQMAGKMNVLDRTSALSAQEKQLLERIFDDAELLDLHQRVERCMAGAPASYL